MSGRRWWQYRRRGFAFAVVIAMALFAGGWLTGHLLRAPVSGPLRLSAHFDGVVETVDANASAICVRPSDGSAQRCSVPFMRTGTQRLSVGDQVEITVARLGLEDGSTQEIFIIDRPEPGY